MKVRQVELGRKDGSRMVVWVDADKVTRLGMRIKAPNDRWWMVLKLYRQELDTAALRSDWRVGGLL